MIYSNSSTKDIVREDLEKRLVALCTKPKSYGFRRIGCIGGPEYEKQIDSKTNISMTLMASEKVPIIDYKMVDPDGITTIVMVYPGIEQTARHPKRSDISFSVYLKEPDRWADIHFQPDSNKVDLVRGGRLGTSEVFTKDEVLQMARRKGIPENFDIHKATDAFLTLAEEKHPTRRSVADIFQT